MGFACGTGGVDKESQVSSRRYLRASISSGTTDVTDVGEVSDSSPWVTFIAQEHDAVLRDPNDVTSLSNRLQGVILCGYDACSAVLELVREFANRIARVGRSDHTASPEGAQNHAGGIDVVRSEEGENVAFSPTIVGLEPYPKVQSHAFDIRVGVDLVCVRILEDRCR